MDKGDIRDTNDLEKLQKHWALAEAIGAIVEQPLKSIPSDKLEANLKVIEGAEFPASSSSRLRVTRRPRCRSRRRMAVTAPALSSTASPPGTSAT
eukprot:3362074-Pyramimonas_sp.AAC.2